MTYHSTSKFFHLQFIKTPRFTNLRIKLRDNEDNSLEEFPVMSSNASTPSVPPGLNDEEEVGGAYVTVSQRAAAVLDRSQNERAPHP